MRISLRALVALAALATVDACDGYGDCSLSSSPCASTYIAVVPTPSALTIVRGDTATLTVTVTSASRVRPTVRWTSGDPAVASVVADAYDEQVTHVVGATNGSTRIEYMVTTGAQVVSGSVPVTVR